MFADVSSSFNIVYFSGHGVAGREDPMYDDDTRGALCIGPTADLSELTLSELRAEAAREHLQIRGHKGLKQTYIDALQREELLTLGDVLELWTAARQRSIHPWRSELRSSWLLDGVPDSQAGGRLARALDAAVAAPAVLLHMGPAGGRQSERPTRSWQRLYPADHQPTE